MNSRKIAPWTVRGSRYLLKDRWISLRADSCVSNEGVEFDPWYVLEYPDWVQVIALTDDGHIILVELYRHGAGIISRELPTGGVDSLDEDPISAAKRELREETGFAARDWELVASLCANPANQPNQTHIILARGAYRVGDPADDPYERINPLLMPVGEAVAFARSGGLRQAMHVAGLALALTPLGLWR